MPEIIFSGLWVCLVVIYVQNESLYESVDVHTMNSLHNNTQLSHNVLDQTCLLYDSMIYKTCNYFKIILWCQQWTIFYFTSKSNPIYKHNIQKHATSHDYSKQVLFSRVITVSKISNQLFVEQRPDRYQITEIYINLLLSPTSNLISLLNELFHELISTDVVDNIFLHTCMYTVSSLDRCIKIKKEVQNCWSFPFLQTH